MEFFINIAIIIIFFMVSAVIKSLEKKSKEEAYKKPVPKPIRPFDEKYSVIRESMIFPKSMPLEIKSEPCDEEESLQESENEQIVEIEPVQQKAIKPLEKQPSKVMEEDQVQSEEVLSLQELKRGFILSTILGPPKAYKK